MSHPIISMLSGYVSRRYKESLMKAEVLDLLVEFERLFDQLDQENIDRKLNESENSALGS